MASHPGSRCESLSDLGLSVYHKSWAALCLHRAVFLGSALRLLEVLLWEEAASKRAHFCHIKVLLLFSYFDAVSVGKHHPAAE